MQTVRCRFVHKQKEQLQGTVRGARGKLLKRNVANVSSRQKKKVSDLTAVFALCGPDTLPRAAVGGRAATWVKKMIG